MCNQLVPNLWWNRSFNGPALVPGQETTHLCEVAMTGTHMLMKYDKVGDTIITREHKEYAAKQWLDAFDPHYRAYDGHAFKALPRETQAWVSQGTPMARQILAGT